MFNHHQLKCYKMSLDSAKRIPTITGRWPKGFGYLADQLKRAMASVVLNIAEGNGRVSIPERRRFFDIAKASASETSAIMDLALAYHLIDRVEHDYLQDMLLQVYKILCKLR